MDGKRTLAALYVIVAAVSVATGIWGKDGAMVAFSALGVLFSFLTFLYCSSIVYRYSALMSVTVLICTILAVSVASYGTLVDGGVMSEYQWALVGGVIQGAAAIPVMIMFYFTAAAVFNASYNRILVSGLIWLVGMGMQVPKCILIFVVQFTDLQQGIISNNTLVIMMLVNLIIFLAFSLIIYPVFKKNRYLITAKGLEVIP